MKADANPGVNNVAYTDAEADRLVQVRCAELCGIWHGAMYDYGKVVPVAAFMTWTHATEIQLAARDEDTAAVRADLRPDHASPTWARSTRQLGLTSAGGGYYNPADPEQP